MYVCAYVCVCVPVYMFLLILEGASAFGPVCICEWMLMWSCMCKTLFLAITVPICPFPVFVL